METEIYFTLNLLAKKLIKYFENQNTLTPTPF